MSARLALYDQICEIMSAHKDTTEVYASEYIMEPGEAVVGYRLKVNLPDLWVRLDVSASSVRPPFEWMGEITLDGATGLQHYLIREHDVVSAVRKSLTELIDMQIKEVLEQLEAVKDYLKASGEFEPGKIVLAI